MASLDQAKRYLSEAEDEYFQLIREEAGDEFCQWDRDETTNRIKEICRVADRAYDVVRDYSDAVQEGLFFSLLVDVAEAMLGDYRSFVAHEAAIMTAALRVLMAGGEV